MYKLANFGKVVTVFNNLKKKQKPLNSSLLPKWLAALNAADTN